MWHLYQYIWNLIKTTIDATSGVTLKCIPTLFLYLRPTLYLHGADFVVEPTHGLQGGVVIRDLPLASNKVFLLKDGHLRLLMILQFRNCFKMFSTSAMAIIHVFQNWNTFLDYTRKHMIIYFKKIKATDMWEKSYP